jgi:adenosine deaminase
LSKEASLLVSEGGLESSDVRQFALDGINAAFCAEQVRLELLVEWSGQ